MKLSIKFFITLSLVLAQQCGALPTDLFLWDHPLTFLNVEKELPEKKIVVVVSNYNNPPEIVRDCLTSILTQNYEKFEVLFCDDCSPGNQQEWQKQLIKELDIQHRVTYISNPERYGATGNQWHAFHAINPDNHLDNRDIVVVNVDGDDVLLVPDSLKKVNQLHEYAWVTYGQYRNIPSGALGHCKAVDPVIIAANAWRDGALGDFPTSHLRTYRLSLLKDLPLQALLYYGQFYPAGGDTALMWSLCEKAGAHAVFNPEPVYGYRDTDQNDWKLRLATVFACAQYAKDQKKFTPLQELPVQLPADQYSADLIIFSYNRPLQLYALLESVQEYITGLDHITVLYRADEEQYKQAYYELQECFSSITFVRQKNPSTDFKSLLLHILCQSQCEYLMFAVDDNLVKDFVCITDCIRVLQKTHAYGFYLRLGKNLTVTYMAQALQPLPFLVHVEEGIFAWQFGAGHYDWSYPNTVDMTLYAKKDILPALQTMKYTNPNTLEGTWFSTPWVDAYKVGLCFETSKIVNIPNNRVQNMYPNAHMGGNCDELLELFNRGYKIDRRPFHQCKNPSAHTEYVLNLIPR